MCYKQSLNQVIPAESPEKDTLCHFRVCILTWLLNGVNKNHYQIKIQRCDNKLLTIRFTLLSCPLHNSRWRQCLHCGGGGGRGRLRATQVSIKGTNVNKIEDYNHLNSNHKQQFKKWEELLFCF